MFHSGSHPENRWEIQMFASDNSNFYLQLYYEIIIIITKTFPNILQIAIWSFYWCIILTFTKIGVYIVHKMDGSLILFHTTQVKLWDLNTSQYFWTLVNLKFGHNLMFSITLENIKLYYNLFIKNMCFYYLLKCKEISYLKAIQEMMINIKTNAMEWKILFLEKFRKKIIKFGVSMTKKYKSQVLISD